MMMKTLGAFKLSSNIPLYVIGAVLVCVCGLVVFDARCRTEDLITRRQQAEELHRVLCSNVTLQHRTGQIELCRANDETLRHADNFYETMIREMIIEFLAGCSSIFQLSLVQGVLMVCLGWLVYYVAMTVMECMRLRFHYSDKSRHRKIINSAVI